MTRILDRVRRVTDSGDSGMTLTELIVAMGIFTMVLVVSLAAVVTMSQTTVRAQVTSDTTSQIRTVFQRFDKELRYASEINSPGASSGDYYVEYLVPATVADSDSMCVQWRYETDADELQRRTWEPGVPEGVSGWATMVTGLRNDLSDADQRPFVVHDAGPDGTKVFTRQKLDIYLDAGLGDAGDGRGGQLKVTFVALNSSVASETNSGADTVCLEGAVQRP